MHRAQGRVPFSQALVRSKDANRLMHWDVTMLVQDWFAPHGRGMMIAVVVRAVLGNGGVPQPRSGAVVPAPSGRALRVGIRKGEHIGLDLRYRFAATLGAEPEEICSRCYLRFGRDWKPVTDDGKLRGISGTCGKAGWGGRPSAGDTGSRPGGFQPGPDNPCHAYTPIGPYLSPRHGRFLGEHWAWPIGLHALLKRNRWYCIEQHLRLNRPGQRDAVLRGRVDGRLAVEKSGFRLHEAPAIRIEQIRMKVYCGGGTASPKDQDLFIDNVVIARRYIGPMAQ